MKAERCRRIRLVLLAVFAAAVVAVPSAVWAGLTDVSITGTVRDMLGNPIASARVSDGRTAVYTNPDGQYAISESLGTSFSLTASKTGYVTKTKSAVAMPGTVVNFDLLFTLKASASPVYSNVTPITLTLAATSIAPSDTVVTAEPGTSTVQLTFVETVAGSTTWRGDHTLGSETADGTYSFTFKGRNAGTMITNAPSKDHVLDRILPVLSLEKVLPASGSTLETHSAFPTLAIDISDDRSGVDPTSVSFDLTAPAGTTSTVTPKWNGQTAEYAFSAEAQSGVWGWRAKAADRSGNSAEKNIAFTVHPIVPFVDLPPVVAIAGQDVQIKAVVPVEAGAVKLRLTAGGIAQDIPLTLQGRAFVGSIPGTLVVPGLLTYEIIATTDSGDVASNDYPLWVGTVAGTGGDFPLVTAVQGVGVTGLWGPLDGQFGFQLGDEQAPVGPASFALDRGLTPARSYVMDNANSRIQAFSNGLRVLTISNVPNTVIDLAVVPALHYILALTPLQLIIYDQSGNMLSLITLNNARDILKDKPDPSQCDPMVQCPWFSATALTVVPDGSSYDAFITAGSDEVWLYPVILDGNPATVEQMRSLAVPGFPLADGVYLKTGFLNGQVVVGIIDGIQGTTSVFPIPGVPGAWIPDSIGDVTMDLSTLSSRITRVYVPVGVHREDSSGFITENLWQVFGIDVEVSVCVGIDVCGPRPSLSIAPVLRAEIPDVVLPPHNRIFNGGGTAYLYQMTSDGTNLQILIWSWVGL